VNMQYGTRPITLGAIPRPHQMGRDDRKSSNVDVGEMWADGGLAKFAKTSGRAGSDGH